MYIIEYSPPQRFWRREGIQREEVEMGVKKRKEGGKKGGKRKRKGEEKKGKGNKSGNSS